ncbi:MAG: LamG-like jellyroll fold domain-containing protein [Candidatus Paceibacterota bacterium]
MNKSTKTKLAFTLIELLVVIAIIGILSALIVVGMNSTTRKATVAKAQVFSNSLRNSLMGDLISEWRLDEKNGVSPNFTTPDSWKGNNSGTLYGSGGLQNFPQLQTAANCVSNGCFSFDGTDDYISFGTDDSFNIGSGESFTISLWAKSIESKPSAIITKGRWSTGTIGWILHNASNPQDLYFVFDDGTIHVEKQLYTGRIFDWTNFVLTTSSSNYTIYVNGRESYDLSRTFNDITNGDNLIIGANSVLTPSYFLNGFIDEVRIYDQVMPASQIEQNYFVGLNKLLAKGNIGDSDYRDQVFTTSANYGKR